MTSHDVTERLFTRLQGHIMTSFRQYLQLGRHLSASISRFVVVTPLFVVARHDTSYMTSYRDLANC